jgi:hypothetical protein
VGNYDPAGGSPESELIQLAALPRLHLIELVSRIAGGVALDPRSRNKVRAAEELSAILVDYFEIEISGQRQRAYQIPFFGLVSWKEFESRRRSS